MESGVVSKILEPNDSGTYIWFVLLSIFFLVVWAGFQGLANVAEIRANWSKYRCQPSVMPFASLYGHEVNENFNYCMKNIFAGQMGAFTGPFGTILSSLIMTCMGFLQNLNSLRIMLATLVGGVTKVFTELTERFQLIMTQVKTTSMRIQFLMKRVFGTFYAIIYMATSGIQAGINFSNTTIFGFLSTFCFHGDTRIDIEGRGQIPIRDICLGDRLTATGKHVTSVYTFIGDGQPMRLFLPKSATPSQSPNPNTYPYPILVSTNHLIKYKGTWISVGEHPEAREAPLWSGGKDNLLYCLDTENHELPIGPYMFSDYDETTESDVQTMQWVDTILNGIQTIHTPNTVKQYPWLYQPCCDPDTRVRLKDNSSKRLSDISIGDVLSTGRVTGIVRRHVNETSITPNGTRTTPSTLVWTEREMWERVGHIDAETVYTEMPREMIGLIVMDASWFETIQGDMVRDFMEVHSPDAEKATTAILC